MRTIMATRTTPHESSSSSKRGFKWVMRKNDGGGSGGEGRKEKEEKEEDILSSFSSSSFSTFRSPSSSVTAVAAPAKKKAPQAAAAAATAVSRFRLAVTSAFINAGRQNRNGPRVITGTLYGHRRGHVHLAFQVDPKSRPFVLLELATPTNSLVREMASGLVRIALECVGEICDIKTKEPKRKLLEETVWLAYCNGRKCGYAVGRECGPADWKVLEAVGPVSMGAGVTPKGGGGREEEEEEGDGEVMYMRARFERVVGSRDSEAFYMMSPDGKGGTELSIFFLRV